MLRFLPLMLLAIACSGGDDDDGGDAIAADDFGELYMEAYCGAGCTGDLSSACDATTTTTTNTGAGECDYDADAAADCVDPAGWTCEPLISGSSDTYPVPPSSCLAVCS